MEQKVIADRSRSTDDLVLSSFPGTDTAVLDRVLSGEFSSLFRNIRTVLTPELKDELTALHKLFRALSAGHVRAARCAIRTMTSDILKERTLRYFLGRDPGMRTTVAACLGSCSGSPFFFSLLDACLRDEHAHVRIEARKQVSAIQDHILRQQYEQQAELANALCTFINEQPYFAALQRLERDPSPSISFAIGNIIAAEKSMPDGPLKTALVLSIFEEHAALQEHTDQLYDVFPFLQLELPRSS